MICPILAHFENVALGIVRTGCDCGCWSNGNPYDHFFSDGTNSPMIESLTCEPLAAALAVYARRLHEDGYGAQSGFVQLRLLGCFSRSLGRRTMPSPTTLLFAGQRQKQVFGGGVEYLLGIVRNSA